MESVKLDKFLTRERVMKLLSDSEIASLSRAEATVSLPSGEAYIDLQHPVQVRIAGDNFTKVGNILPRTAVHENTWNKILLELQTPVN